MRSILRSTLVAMAAAVAVSTTSSAQSAQGAKVDPCSLVSLAEVKQATGNANYTAGERGDDGDGVGGGDPCTFDGIGMDRAPTVSVISIAPNAKGRYYDWLKRQTPRPGCTRNAVPGLGVDAFIEECAKYVDLPLYMRGKSYDVVVGIRASKAGDFAASRPVVLALAKSVAPKIR